jgi:hypothetical protein
VIVEQAGSRQGISKNLRVYGERMPTMVDIRGGYNINQCLELAELVHIQHK